MSLSIIVLTPVLFALILHFAPPYYEKYLPVLFEYRALILAFFCILSSGLMGFILSFIILDEKDQKLVPVFMVMPYPFLKLLLLRSALILVLAFASCLLLIFTTDFIEHSLLSKLTLALACSIIAPTSTFLVTSFAKNKIEGVTYFKLFNMLLIIPVAGIFVNTPLTYIFGIIPYYWVYNGFYNVTGISQSIILIIAMVLNLLLFCLVLKTFIKKHSEIGGN